MKIENIKQRFSVFEYGLLLLCFSICLAGAILLPTEMCPDEDARSNIIYWMVDKGTLPTGDEPETMMLSETLNYGFSYALRPFLPAMISAVFVKIATLFTGSARVLLAIRLCSVFSITGCCYLCLLLGRRLFNRRSSALLFAAIVCFQPQVMYLGMYHNNDAMSLLAVCMMLYFLVDGYSKRWPVKSCIGLAVSFSIGLLTYYSIYGWILMSILFLVVSVIMDRGIPKRSSLILKRGALIAGICLLLAGWFFIRNAILHDGDFFGIAYEEASRARIEAMGYKMYQYVCPRRDGYSMLEFFRMKDYEWFWMSAKSFVGVFSSMTIYLPSALYGIYSAVFVCGVLLAVSVMVRRRPCRRDGLLMIMMAGSVIINIALHFWQSYARDYQPQGRYVISTVLLLGYLIAYGMDNTSLSLRESGEKKAVALHPAAALTLVWLLLFAWACIGTMSKMLQ